MVLVEKLSDTQRPRALLLPREEDEKEDDVIAGNIGIDDRGPKLGKAFIPNGSRSSSSMMLSMSDCIRSKGSKGRLKKG